MLPSGPAVAVALINSQSHSHGTQTKPTTQTSQQSTRAWGKALEALSLVEERLAVDGCLEGHFSSGTWQLELVVPTLDGWFSVHMHVRGINWTQWVIERDGV